MNWNQKNHSCNCNLEELHGVSTFKGQYLQLSRRKCTTANNVMRWSKYVKIYCFDVVLFVFFWGIETTLAAKCCQCYIVPLQGPWLWCQWEGYALLIFLNPNRNQLHTHTHIFFGGWKGNLGYLPRVYPANKLSQKVKPQTTYGPMVLYMLHHSEHTQKIKIIGEYLLLGGSSQDLSVVRITPHV